jgi:methyltransferase-like protein
MESTRNDQVRMKAAEQFSEFLKYISAANVVPSRQDFENMRELINAVNDGILDTETSADISVTTSEDFQTT